MIKVIEHDKVINTRLHRSHQTDSTKKRSNTTQLIFNKIFKTN